MPQKLNVFNVVFRHLLHPYSEQSGRVSVRANCRVDPGKFNDIMCIIYTTVQIVHTGSGWACATRYPRRNGKPGRN